MKNKKPWRYMKVTGNVVDGKEFPPTKARKQFKLPWRVMGKGLDNARPINQASGEIAKL